VEKVNRKVCVITGGSSGIGKALAFEFGKNGYAIGISGRNKERLDEAVNGLNEIGVEALGFGADVSDLQDSIRFRDEVIAKFGKMDVLINNAGISMRALFKDLDPSVIKKVVDINLMGAVYCSKAFLPEIIKSRGSIVGISSVAGYRGLPGRTGYSAAKFGLQGFLEALRTEMISEGVHVLIACPGFTSSNIRKSALVADGSSQGNSPLEEGKMMSAEEVAKRIFRAVERRKKFLTLTTQGKLTVLFNKLFPSWMDGKVLEHFKKEKDSPL
jgi:dehydrogenase/reductase SDR family member 7B